MSMVPKMCGIEVRCMQSMVGQTKCVKLGGVIHVSPAQWELMKDAKGDELLHLLKHLPILDMDGPSKPCHRCGGDGVEVFGAKVSVCSVCKGGQVEFPDQRFDFTTERTAGFLV
jgi:hypothetical protein